MTVVEEGVEIESLRSTWNLLTEFVSKEVL